METNLQRALELVRLLGDVFYVARITSNEGFTLQGPINDKIIKYLQSEGYKRDDFDEFHIALYKNKERIVFIK